MVKVESWLASFPGLLGPGNEAKSWFTIGIPMVKVESYLKTIRMTFDPNQPLKS